jgi:hypothetical protein
VASVECASTLSLEVFLLPKIPNPTSDNRTQQDTTNRDIPDMGLGGSALLCVVAEEDSDEKGFKRQPPSEKEEH